MLTCYACCCLLPQPTNHPQAYTWLGVWYVFFTFEACYVKYVCDNVKMSNWWVGRGGQGSEAREGRDREGSTE